MANLSDNTFLRNGSYRIIRYISSGGFGCTYEAEHVMLHKRVAIKEFFPKDFCNRDEETAHVTVGTQSKKMLVEKLRRKFLDEAISLSRLQHPGIVRVTDVFEENGTAYYVMDYIDGMSLNDLVKRTGPLPEKKALDYIIQVAKALRYVHENNRLHLDIKPANIMVDSKGHAVLIDFGASKQYDEENGENTSTLMGKTPGYAPLEQMGNDVVKFTPATDIYALGATLYKLLTGQTPPSATLLATDDELLSFPDHISPEVRDAVLQAMKRSKKQRPQSIDEFLKLLPGGKNVIEADDETIVDDDVVVVHKIVEPEKKKVVVHTEITQPCKEASPWKARLKQGLSVGTTVLLVAIGRQAYSYFSGGSGSQYDYEPVDSAIVEEWPYEELVEDTCAVWDPVDSIAYAE